MFLIAQHYEILISRTLRKEELKACLVAGLFDKGVFPSMETVSTSAAELAAPAAGSPPLRVSIGDPVTPVTGVGAEVGPSFSMPKFEPLSLSTEASPVIRSDSRLKLRLARLQLETQDKAQARQDDLKRQIEMYRIDADTKV